MNFPPAVSPSAGLTAAQMENNLILHRKFQEKKMMKKKKKKKRVGLANSPPFFPPL